MIKNWFIRLFGIWLLILSVSWLAGCETSLETSDGCGGWQAQPLLLGAWENDTETVLVTPDRFRTGQYGTPYIYTVCVVGGHDIIYVNSVPYPYWTDGQTFVLDGTVYVRSGL